MLIEQIITERFVNAIGFDDKAKSIKLKYMDQVWSILQTTYAAIGGIRGDGFSSPEEMVEQIPMWKIAVLGGQVKAVILYKDSNGRKSVAAGTDSSKQGIKLLVSMFQQEIYRAYGEKSKAVLSSVMKLIPWDVLQNFVIPPARVAQMAPDKIITPITQIDQSEWPEDAKMSLQRYPQLLPYGYMRDIGGYPTFKVMIGTPSKPIR